jgi:hypothetical protein
MNMTQKDSEKELSKLINSISNWRKDRESLREVIPEEILVNAGKLADKYSIGFVANQLKLNHGRLKPYFNPNPIQLISNPPEMIEIKGLTSLDKTHVEIIKPCGAKLSVSINHQYDLKMMVDSFMGVDKCYN